MSHPDKKPHYVAFLFTVIQIIHIIIVFGGVSTSMLTLNEAIIDVKKG